MNEAIVTPKRKTVEISLPSFSWKDLFSLKSAFFFSALFLCTILAYWMLAVRPFLWVSSGRVEAISLQIRSNEEGILSRLPVQAGDIVKKGESLFFLENNQIVEKQKRIQKSILDLQEEQSAFKRQSEKAMQDYLADLGVLQQEAIEQHLQLFQEAQSKMVELGLQIDALESEVTSLSQQMEKQNIVAPFDGVVLKQNKLVGDGVKSGEPVLSLFDLKRSWIEVKVPETKLHLIELGQTAKIRLPSYPGREWQGAIVWIGPATVSRIEGAPASTDEESIPVRISLPIEKFPVKPGLSAEVGIKVH